LPIGSGHAPLLKIGVKRGGKVAGTDLVVMVDTGADETLLHIHWAGLMGFRPDQLKEESSKSASGTMTVYRPGTCRGIEFQIGESWFAVPSVRFAKKVPISLLGRDMIFAHFNLWMTGTLFDLYPRGSV
jgi:hypothetical protein